MCNGTGRNVAAGLVASHCPGCKARYVTETGLTEGQVEMHLGWLKEYEAALRTLVEVENAPGSDDTVRIAAWTTAKTLLAKRRLS